MSKIRVGDKVFASKKDATEAVRKILYSYDLGMTLGAEDEAFMLGVFALHREWAQKRGCGVASIEVEQNMGSRGFWLTRLDGSRTDISFVKAINPPSHECDVRAALREAVRPQIQDYKRRHLVAGAVCAVTGEALTEENSHVDHAPRAFDGIVADYMTVSRISFADIAVTPTTDGETRTLLADRSLARDWQEFHALRASLRLVTKRANLSLLRRRAAR